MRPALRGMLREYRTAFNPIVTSNTGRILKTTGDGLPEFGGSGGNRPNELRENEATQNGKAAQQRACTSFPDERQKEDRTTHPRAERGTGSAGGDFRGLACDLKFADRATASSRYPGQDRLDALQCRRRVDL